MTTVQESVFSWRFATRALAWGAAMLGVLQLQYLSGPWSHVICGPWGCGPPLEAVVTCHLVWILLLVPPVLVLLKRLSPAALRMVGAITTAVGVAGLVAVAVWVAAIWYPRASAIQRSYVYHMYAYTLACLVDVPIVQLVISGAILLASGRRFGRAGSAEHESMESVSL